MIKKLLLLAVMAMALTSFVASIAQGTSTLRWTDKNKHLEVKTDPVIHATGTAKFSNVTLGGTECPITAEVQLTGGSATAHVVEFVVDENKTSECKLNGPLATSCAALTGHDVTGADPVTQKANGKTLTTLNGGAWLATGTKNGAGVASLDILSEIQIHNTYSAKPEPDGKLCPKNVTLESTATAKPTVTFDSSTAATKATLGGTLTATNSITEEHLGNVNVTGTITFTEPFSGTYGIT